MKSMKGIAGKKTGAKTRSAIKSAQRKGYTLEQIGNRVSRDASTLSAIKSGEIKNPPSNLSVKINNLPDKKKRK